METGQLEHLVDKQAHNLGYPANLAYDYQPLVETEKPFRFHFNNIGDPDENPIYDVHTKEQERRVIRFCCDLWKFPPEKTWGYVTASGTEGNTQALYIARELFPTGILYFSKDSHYSIKKIAHMLKIPYMEVDTYDNGEMDYRDFENKLVANITVPAIINANIGTTMTGAIDDTRHIFRIIQKHKKTTEYFLHADGALSGFLLPFFEKDIFFKRYIHSISISGHKFLGVPFPCGIFLLDTATRKKRDDGVGEFVEYISCQDCTIAGSRSGHGPLFLDYIIKEKGMEGFEKDAAGCIENADYLITKLAELNYDPWRNNNSITVVFRQPNMDLVKKWKLASQQGCSYVVVLPHVTKEVIDRFIVDLKGTSVSGNFP